MADVTRRRTGELLRKLFEILLSQPDGLQARDALARVEAEVELTPYERGHYESGERRFDKIIRFATVDCVKAGWFLKNKGRWTVTEEGKKAYASLPDPEAFYRRAVKLYNEWKASQLAVEPEGDEAPTGESGTKAASITFEEAEEHAWREIQQFLEKMKPYDFQDLVASLLRAMGYYVSWVAPPGKDGGIDIVAATDPLATKTPRIKVQVKRQQATVDVHGVRAFMAVLGDHDVGLFISIGGFTKDALDEARTQERRRVTLINLEQLFDLWVDHYSRLEDTARRRLPLRPIHFLSPEP